MKKIFLLTSVFICFVFSINLKAQKGSTIVFGKSYTKEQVKAMNGVIRCATTEYEDFLQKNDSDRMTDAEFEVWLAPFVQEAKTNKSQNGGIITIPVVVHVIHSGQPVGVAPNITDNQVISQITVMNQDFRRMSGTPGFNASPVGADTMIQFALAKVDPNGNPTNGIDRVNLCKTSYTTGEVNSLVKPQTIWDPTVYMNMWSVQFGGSSSSILGYAQFPSGSGLPGLNANGGAASTDGVVANFSTFGSSTFNDGTFLLSAPYDKGRTMTHEVGHFLGLRHIWGDATCGDDFCTDTPTAHTANYSCNKNIVSCNNPSVFEMVENYMDYTNDTCMNIFTLDQKARITAVMNNSVRRMELKTSTADIDIPLFANDAEIKFERSCTTANVTCTSSSAGSFNMVITNRGTAPLTSAVINYTINGIAQTYNFTGNLALHKSATVTVAVPASVPSGSLIANIVSVNGTSDQRVSNDTFNAAYVSNSAQNYQFNTVKFTLQRDGYASETTWDLKNSAGTTLYSGGPYTDATPPNLQPVITETWNLSANDCYTFTINDSYGDGICCSVGNGYVNLKNSDGTVTIYSGGSFGFEDKASFKIMTLGTAEVAQNQFSIYPNPVSDVLNITKVSDKATFEIYGVTGQMIKKGDVKDGKVVVSELLKGNYIIKISDKEVSNNLKFIKK